jgi:DNA modification methylase
VACPDYGRADWHTCNIGRGRDGKLLLEMNKILNTDCIEGIRTLPDKCVNTCVTSPPYYGLRDYGEDGQIGLEETPDAYVKRLVEVFREVRRVLKDDGTLWLNLGDSYAGNCSRVSSGRAGYGEEREGVFTRGGDGLKPKDLIGIPWMVAFALRADGWYLRQDIIWHKPNPMPESVTDRCTKSHEYIFLLSKSGKYYFDNEAIKEEAQTEPHSAGNKKLDASRNDNVNNIWGADGKRNKRSVWTVTTKPYSGAHFATYPQDLIVDCIKAGCPKDGLVLDPFMGAGTTALVARKLGRNYIGTELNPDYVAIAEQRLTEELGLFP